MNVFNFRKHTWIMIVVIATVALATLSCNLFGAQPETPEPVEEMPVVQEPEPTEEPAEPAFKPELVLRLNIDDGVDSVAYSQDGSQIATGAFRLANIWDLADGNLIGSIETDHSVDFMAFLPGDDTLALAVNTRGTQIHQVANSEEILKIDDRGFDPVLALSPDGNVLATGNRAGLIWLWQVSDGERLFEMDPSDIIEGYTDSIHTRTVRALAFSTDGKLVASGHIDGMVFIWNAQTGQLERLIDELQDTRSRVTGLAFTNDGQFLAVNNPILGVNTVVNLWNVADGSLYLELALEGARGWEGPIAFSSDDSMLAFGSTAGIFIWSLPDYSLLYTIPIEDPTVSDWVKDLAFSPDSRYLLAGYRNEYAVLWQVQE